MDRRHRLPWHLYLLAALAVVVIVLAISDIGAPSSSARTSTEIVTAEKGVVQSTVTGSGNVEPSVDDDVNFQTSGTLSHVDVTSGQHVHKGQLLATLDSTTAQLSLDEAEANLTAAEDQLTSAEDGTSASTSSASSSTTSSASSIASAQASVDSGEASVQSAQEALDETNLYAPVSGTIVSLSSLGTGASVSAGSTSSASSGSSDSSSSGSSSSSGGSTTAGSLGSSSSSSGSGSSSSSSSPFAEIVNTSTMTMTVAFSESDISKLKVGQAATVTMDALSGVELAAHVSEISDVGSTSSGVVSYDATLTLDQGDAQIKPGMSASASVVVDQVQGLTVPNSAVSGSGSLGTVELRRNGKNVSQQVVVGLRGDSRTQIISGLSAGDQLVVTTTLPSLSSSSTSSSSGSSGTLGGSSRFGGGGLGGGFAGGGFAAGT